MKKASILLALFLFSCSQPIQKQSKLVKTPTLYPAKNYSSKLYDEPFFKEEHFNYVISRQTKDTTKRNYTSETTVIEGKVRQYFRNCEVTLDKNALVFQLTDTPFSDGRYELKFVKSPGVFEAKYNQTFSITDSSYKKPVFKVIDKNVVLDKDTYVKGELLRGKFSFQIAASHLLESKYSDTISMYGFVKTIIK
ncbi:MULTISPECIES: hypothetical protein [Mucilaginibacter]|jgi:hypothetical protein|uniref:hypothetical protein n=1 Tax=Mucilaginibacter TaxID=423349 RepID=UPI00087135DE|nr:MULTISPECIES: hypothetical protein [Mucilaginibacter]GGB16334.1 hypothetical protein GCM10011500_35460 [Mucilaginibacter rubeus]SCW77728.1 hypothetical protein SAMN03159284_04088 [Mucilaginibacter sp. NFR10]